MAFRGAWRGWRVGLGALLWMMPMRLAWAEGDDPWLGRDKALHFGVSAGVPVLGYAAGSALFEERGPRLAVAMGTSVSLGIAKELYDLLNRGDPSWRDLAWDVAGAVVGTALMWGFDRLVVEQPRARWKAERLALERERELDLATYRMEAEYIRQWLKAMPVGRTPTGAPAAVRPKADEQAPERP